MCDVIVAARSCLARPSSICVPAGDGRVDAAPSAGLWAAEHVSMSLPPYVVMPMQQQPLPLQQHAGHAAGPGAAHADEPAAAAPPQGAVGSPEPLPLPRPRAVTFVDEGPVGPPDRVRLAPSELFRSMHDSLKS